MIELDEAYWAELPPPPATSPWGRWFVARAFAHGGQPDVRLAWQIDFRLMWDAEVPKLEGLVRTLNAELSETVDGHPAVVMTGDRCLRLVYYARASDDLLRVIRKASAAEPGCLVEVHASEDASWSRVGELLGFVEREWSHTERHREVVLNDRPRRRREKAMVAADGHVPRAGHIIDNRYLVGRPMGLDGVCLRYEANEVGTGAPITLVVAHELALSQKRLARDFRSRAERACSVDSPHATGVYRVGELPSGAPYFACERLFGRTVQEALRVGRFDAHGALYVATQAAHALGSAHGVGLSHPQLTSSSLVLVARTDNPWFTKVAGLEVVQPGWADMPVALPFPRPTRWVSTYLAPEQALGHASSPASDIYALGVILYEMITGSPSFTGADSAIEQYRAKATGRVVAATERVPGLPVALDRLFEKALGRHPSTRYSSMREFAEALQEVSTRLAPPEATAAESTREPSSVGLPAGQGVRSMVGDEPDAPAETLRTRLPKTTLVRARAAGLSVRSGLALEEIRRALRELLVAEHEGSTPDGLVAREASAKCFLDALEIVLKARLDLLRTALRDGDERLLRFQNELAVYPWGKDNVYYAARLSQYLVDGAEPSLEMVGRWMGLQGAGDLVCEYTEVAPSRVDDVIAAGKVRHVLAHLSDYKRGKRRKLGRAAPWFKVEDRGDGTRRIQLRFRVVRWLETVVCAIAEGKNWAAMLDSLGGARDGVASH